MGRERTFGLHAGFPVVARMPLLPVESGEPADPLSGSFAEGLRFASRSLATVASDDLDADERLASTVRAYEHRARHRATPRGAFAGVQVAEVAKAPARFRVGRNHRARSTPSAAWLSELALRVAAIPEVLANLRFAANDLVVRRGDRFEHEYSTGAKKPERVTVRATPAVEQILETCRPSADLKRLVAAVNERWPGVPAATVRATALELVRTGLLLTDLLPDDVSQDPLRYLLMRVPASHELTKDLLALRDLLAEADKYAPGAEGRLGALVEAREVCDRIVRHESPITIDVSVDAEFQVPSSLVTEGTQAASLLWSIMPTSGTLETYHARFIDRFGMDRRVPLLSVVDPVKGLGDPDDDDDHPAPEETRRSRVLADLAAVAMRRSSTVVELDDVVIDALRVEGTASPPATGELYAQVVAQSPDDAVDGKYMLAAYLGCTQDAGSTIGRFASLLDLPGPGAMEWGDGGPVEAEIVVRPRLAALTTVTLPSGFAPVRICVGVLPGPGDLTLADLDLASDGQRLRLWSRSLDREVVPQLYSRIGPAYLPPAVRLLQDLANSGSRPWHVWMWGPMNGAPFLPEVRWRRTILSPARWRLPHALITAVRDAAAWETELDRWRAGAVPQPPRVVVTQDVDQRLPLDLDDSRDRDLLRRYVRRGVDAVTAPPGGPDALQAVADGADGRHVVELVIPLEASHPQADGSDQRRPIESTPTVVHVPGGRWLSLAIASPVVHHEDLLARISDLGDQVRDDVDHWFWLRYDNRAHGPHLRLRFTGDPATLNNRVLPAVSAQCARWMDTGLASRVAIEPYEPEIDRYGGPAAIDAAERLFHTDSRLVLAFLADRPDADTRVQLAAHSAMEISRGLARGARDAVGRPRLDRPSRRRVNELRVPARGRPSHLLDEGAQDLWALRARELAKYGGLVPEGRSAECASSVIHMHANRLGLGHDDERLARALAAELIASGDR
ncbi:lantibiotic dehydratase [Myceligenerans pegani]|nr:lantibiotic dehydratase [Myceligenerans sp. TRM 65318]